MQDVNKFDGFESNEEKVDVILLDIQQIGETAKKLSDKFKPSVPNIE